jgi:hypothetical protein
MMICNFNCIITKIDGYGTFDECMTELARELCTQDRRSVLVPDGSKSGFYLDNNNISKVVSTILGSAKFYTNTIVEYTRRCIFLINEQLESSSDNLTILMNIEKIIEYTKRYGIFETNVISTLDFNTNIDPNIIIDIPEPEPEPPGPQPEPEPEPEPGP